MGWRRRIFAVLVVYVAAMGWWATSPWTDTHRLVTPEGADEAFSAYHCPSVFGSGPKVLVPEKETPYVLDSGSPCDEQGHHRVLFFADLGVAGVAMVLLRRSDRRHRAAAEPVFVPVTEGAEA